MLNFVNSMFVITTDMIIGGVSKVGFGKNRYLIIK
jgi:hypothetical protein